ncbi:hypothetical protein ACSSS7_000453 [Eimeria intestinalis]
MPLPDLSPIDDEEVLTLVLLDSTHPQIIAAATEIKNSLLISANQVLKAVEIVKDLLAALENGSAGSEEGKSDAESSSTPPSTLNRNTIEGFLKQTKAIVDSSLKLTLELKITSRGEALASFLSPLVQKLPSPPSPSPPSQASPSESDANKIEIKPQEAGRGRGRGLYPPGAGRGRGLPLARGLGPSVSPLGSSVDSDASVTTPSGPQPDDFRGEAGSAGRKHERDYSPEESQRRWKKKQPSNVDWMLKCRTKLLELKERTAKKAVSDVFMTERVLVNSKEFSKPDFTPLLSFVNALHEAL